MLSHVQCSVTLWTVAHQAPLSMGFFRQEHWNSLPFPSPRDITDPGIQPRSPALQADSLPTEPSGKSIISKRQRWSLFLVSKRNHFLSRRIKPFKTSLFRISWTKVTDYSKLKPDNLYSNLLRQKKKKKIYKSTPLTWNSKEPGKEKDGEREWLFIVFPLKIWLLECPGVQWGVFQD